MFRNGLSMSRPSALLVASVAADPADADAVVEVGVEAEAVGTRASETEVLAVHLGALGVAMEEVMAERAAAAFPQHLRPLAPAGGKRLHTTSFQEP